MGPCETGVQRLCVLVLGLGVSVEPDNHWGSQINQLEQLIDKLECEVRAPPRGGGELVRLEKPLLWTDDTFRVVGFVDFVC